MIETVIAALLPIVVTLFLGFFAGWHHDFDAKQGAVLNRMVMLYALPLALFAGMMGLNRSQLLQDVPMATLLFVGMVGGYFLVLVLSRYVFGRSLKEAALQALAIAGPAVPFVGVPVLGFLYGDLSSLPIALCSLIMNLVQVPITLFILARGTEEAGAPPVSILANIRNTLAEPVVWAPVLAFLMLLVDLHVPADIRSSMQLLGSATGGVALFASGVILFSYHVVLNKTVLINVLAKNIVVPLIVLVVAVLFGVRGDAETISVITMAIPSASVCVILAVQYRAAEQEMASTLFLSTVLSIVTMSAFLFYLH